jgi:hypothetical protein
MHAYYIPEVDIVIVHPQTNSPIDPKAVDLGPAENLDLLWGGELYPMMGAYINDLDDRACNWCPVFYAKEEE